MYYQVVFSFDDEENDPRFSIRPEVSDDAPEDHTSALIDPELAEHEGIDLDRHGFPTSESLEEWHKKHNPQLFND